ncbi:hypothetical protein Hypma_012641 [Hypsizygus marmoreus]|uniref:Uncharacterized protein n=1 Tax=Hypsizygus marmoreus TaxID=39966 RepID=A0A369JN63_HYPMA|nr:hypothetical protein Hypma_012641 [Hypsizygus marmoreus]
MVASLVSVWSSFPLCCRTSHLHHCIPPVQILPTMSDQVSDQVSQVLLGQQKDAEKARKDNKESYKALKENEASRADKRAAQKAAHIAADESKAYGDAAEALKK